MIRTPWYIFFLFPALASPSGSPHQTAGGRRGQPALASQLALSLLEGHLLAHALRLSPTHCYKVTVPADALGHPKQHGAMPSITQVQPSSQLTALRGGRDKVQPVEGRIHLALLGSTIIQIFGFWPALSTIHPARHFGGFWWSSSFFFSHWDHP